MNTTTITGNLTRDPEVKYTTNGTPYTRLSIAVNRRTYNKTTEEWEDELEGFFDATAWNDQAEAAGHLTKGTRVIATGTMQQRHYETEEGERRTRWELRIDELGPSFRFGIPKRNTQPPTQPQEPEPQPTKTYPQQPQALPAVHQADADIPF